MSYGRFMGAENLEMVEGFGALGVVPPRYVADNDNVAGTTCCVTGVKTPRLYMETFAPLEQLPPISGSLNADLRHGDFMQTFSGGVFYPIDPRPAEVHIEDIAHALSMQCRFAGHCQRFYSVAEHSVLMAWWLYRHAGPVTALQGLLHDASEAYLVDIPRPVKPYLTNYKTVEAKVQAVVMERFGLPAEMLPAVKEADDRIIGDELVNLKPMDWHARYDDPLGVTLAYWSPAEAEAKFLSAFEALSEDVRGMSV